MFCVRNEPVRLSRMGAGKVQARGPAARAQAVRARAARTIGHHHRHSAEQRLEVVWQLGAAGVAGVHRNEGVAGPLERQVRALKVELRDLCDLAADDGEDLLRDDREHLEVDAVELVKARPGAAGRQTLEELGHRQVVETVRAVHHDALSRHRLAEVLGGLGLAGSGRPLGCAAEVELQRAHERAVAAIGERRDDEAALQAEILAAVGKGRRDHLDLEALLGVDVVAQLR